MAAWASDLDAFPVDSMYPSNKRFQVRGFAPIAALAAAPTIGCLGSVTMAAAGFALGSFGEFLSLGMGGPFGKHDLVSVGGAMMAGGGLGAKLTCR